MLTPEERKRIEDEERKRIAEEQYRAEVRAKLQGEQTPVANSGNRRGWLALVFGCIALGAISCVFYYLKERPLSTSLSNDVAGTSSVKGKGPAAAFNVPAKSAPTRVSPGAMSRKRCASTGRLRSAPEACSSSTTAHPAACNSSSCGSVPWSSVETRA